MILHQTGKVSIMSQSLKSTAAVALAPEAHDETLNNGLPAAYRKDMAGSLSEILASTYRLLIKSHIYHWNVVGPVFKPIHELTEAHYEALFGATDIIAERIRALGHLAPASMKEAQNFAPTGQDVDHGSAASMVADLVKEHEAGIRAMREACSMADDNSDFVTADMLTDRLNFHEKAVWMWRATISN
jgi:starvation-inducible DNA-binding protein